VGQERAGRRRKKLGEDEGQCWLWGTTEAERRWRTLEEKGEPGLEEEGAWGLGRREARKGDWVRGG
jgi:hypothetical protein